MLQERIEGKWIDCFARVFKKCAVQPGDEVAILSETQSRAINVQLSELALLKLGAKPFHVTIPTPPLATTVPIRSTGASDVIQNMAPVIQALGNSTMFIDVTAEGLLHAPELPEILKLGTRGLMVSNEHPEALERLASDESLEPRVKTGIKMLRDGKEMKVSSAAGTELTINIDGAVAGGGWGYVSRPGLMTHWPGGLCLCFPKSGSVNGELVMDVGDVNLTFKRYVEKAFTLKIEDDYVTEIDGDGVDAELFRSYIAAWGDRDAYAVSHVGWGMNKGARWDSMTMYDRNDFNGTELRAFAGNFVYSTGANEVAGRHTLGHFDLPFRNMTVSVDGEAVVKAGVLQGAVA
jgi:2,5-dihydroxypyridine 5,6-dioxygenase